MAEIDTDAIREQLAAIEHTRWADWQQWMHQQCQRNDDGTLTIPAELVARWERQIATPYAELSDWEQGSDREQVDRYWPIVAAALAEARQETETLRAVNGLLTQRIQVITGDYMSTPEPETAEAADDLLEDFPELANARVTFDPRRNVGAHTYHGLKASEAAGAHPEHDGQTCEEYNAMAEAVSTDGQV